MHLLKCYSRSKIMRCFRSWFSDAEQLPSELQAKAEAARQTSVVRQAIRYTYLLGAYWLVMYIQSPKAMVGNCEEHRPLSLMPACAACFTLAFGLMCQGWSHWFGSSWRLEFLLAAIPCMLGLSTALLSEPTTHLFITVKFPDSAHFVCGNEWLDVELPHINWKAPRDWLAYCNLVDCDLSENWRLWPFTILHDHVLYAGAHFLFTMFFIAPRFVHCFLPWLGFGSFVFLKMTMVRSLTEELGMDTDAVMELFSALPWTAVFVGIFVLARLDIDRAKMKLLRLQTLQKAELINEKVLRCQAEFAIDQQGLRRGPADTVVMPSETNFGVDMSLAGSAQTCPAYSWFARGDPSVSGQQDCPEADCVPSTCFVKADGMQEPQAVQTLMPGQKILCRDSLSGLLEFVEVLSCETQAADASICWLGVDLSDGGSMLLTADHPVHVLRNGQMESVSASNLVPHEHSVAGVCLTHRTIAKVYEVSAEVRKTIRPTTITVRQGERYSPMISPDNSISTSTMAVGSADLTLRQKGTVPSIGRVKQLQRSNSLPWQSKLSPSSNHRLDSESHIVSSSTSSTPDPDCGSCFVLQQRIGAGGTLHGQVSIAAYTELRRLCIPSLGSMRHYDSPDLCQPCRFFSRSGHCKIGILCNYCHENHEHTSRKEMQRRRHQAARISM
eukprot:TRINITY_DN32616_c0_g1_i1.p1 TRINITY_DN32616_c0_g1~~TRINITY_DN32616_c0_g1_i1.p1  ORF type:complete len:669 (+),score=46.40 TRINITY_DN32616_c0_g1_i1:77-2083(+)